MSTARPVESRLPEILEGISAPRTPDYFDDILGQVGRTRQRPRWTFPERWLPMTALSERVATAPRIPMRMAAVLALLLLALAVSIVLIAGSQRPPVPAPFGVAGNGAVVFADTSGAIVAGNVDDDSTRVIVAGRGHSRPVFSPDGKWLAYLQRNGNHKDIVVSNADGASPRTLNAHPVDDVGHFGWAPDSGAIIAGIGGTIYKFDLNGDGKPTLLFEASAGGSWEFLDDFNNSITDIFRPPTGDEVLYVGIGPRGVGVYRKALADGMPIAVLTDQTTTVPFAALAAPQWSPDGKRIAFTLHPPETPDYGRSYVINADGTGLERISDFEMPPGYVVDDEHNSWSPDGTRVAFARWVNDPEGATETGPIVVVDLATKTETRMSNVEVNGYGGWFWSPDGTSIIEIPGDKSADAGRVLVVDASTGQMRDTGWEGNFAQAPSWQRTVPAS